MWIEISIPKTLQMQYSEYQIIRHLNYLNSNKKKNLDSDEEFEPIELWRIVEHEHEAKKFNDE